MRHIKIAEDLFFDLVFFHLLDHYEFEEKIKKGLSDKWDAMLRHEHYSQHKTSSDETVREEARRKYLDSAGISEDFRW